MTATLTRTPAGAPAPGSARPTPVLTVVRFLMLDRVTCFVLPWAWAAFGFVLDVAILAVTPQGDSQERSVGGLSAAFAVVFVLGLVCVAKALPLGLAFGVSRRTYFLGATLLGTMMAVCFGTVVVVGQVVERATGGWGMRMAYFRIPHVLDGPWWQSWLTAFAGFVMLFAYGMWYGLVNRRAGLVGTVTFSAVQGVVLVAAAGVVAWTHGWTGVGHFFTATAAVPSLLAGLALALLAGGLATVRRLTF